MSSSLPAIILWGTRMPPKKSNDDQPITKGIAWKLVTAGMTVIGFAGASHATEELAGRLAAAGADRVIRAMNALPSCIEALKSRI